MRYFVIFLVLVGFTGFIIPQVSAQEEKPIVISDDDLCGSGNKLVDGVCINPNVEHFDTGLNQILLFVSIGVIISIVSFIIWRKRK